ncbi:diacylglycerol kinase family protein, partial [Streptomyces galilaeus]|uniref:diacylglycerol kinase family protein n=1 Tax=Streptomyces galilaeus TaxID=33899 RepID=UPI0038F602A9
MLKLIKSFGYAFKGIYAATLDQLNIKIHWLAVIVVTIAGFFFHITITEWCLVIICFSTVLAAELFNSA